MGGASGPDQDSRDPGATGWCPSAADLVVSKYVAGREEDRDYVRVALRHRLVEPERIAELLDQTPIDSRHRELLRRRVQADVEAADRTE